MFYQVCTKKITAFAAALLLLVCCPAIPAEAEGSSFQTNLEGWTGVESTWNTTDEGYCDGEEQTVEDFAVSNYTVDGTKDFTYTVTLQKKSGYGAGLMLCVGDAASRDGIKNGYLYFIADPGNVYYNAFKDNASVTGPVGRALTDAEKATDTFTFRVKYNAALKTAVFSLNGQTVAVYNSAENFSGRLGLMAHDARIACKSAVVSVQDGGFDTNMTNWMGFKSGWTVTTAGYLDGGERTTFDFAFSDIAADGTKSFVYAAEMERIEGYGFGIAFGAPAFTDSTADPQKECVIFMVDEQSVVYNIRDQEYIGRKLEADEICPVLKDKGADPMRYTFTLSYDAETGEAKLSLNGKEIAALAAADIIGGRLGLLAHDARIYVKSAHYEETGTEPEPATPPATEPIAPTGDSTLSLLFYFAPAFAGCLCISLIFRMKKRSGGKVSS